MTCPSHHRSHGIGPIAADRWSHHGPARRFHHRSHGIGPIAAMIMAAAPGVASIHHRSHGDRPNCSAANDFFWRVAYGHHRSHGIGPIAAGNGPPRCRESCSITDPTGSAQLQQHVGRVNDYAAEPSPIPRDRPNCSDTYDLTVSRPSLPSPIPRDRPNCNRMGFHDPQYADAAITDPTGSAQLRHRQWLHLSFIAAPITDPTGSAQLQQHEMRSPRPPAATHHRSHGIGPIAARGSRGGDRAAPSITDPTGSA